MDTYSGSHFAKSLLSRDFSHVHAFEVPLPQQRSVWRITQPKKDTCIKCRRRFRQLRIRNVCQLSLAAYAPPIIAEPMICNAVHPGHDTVFQQKLVPRFPATGPGSLGHLLGDIEFGSLGKQEPYGQAESLDVRRREGFRSGGICSRWFGKRFHEYL